MRRRFHLPVGVLLAFSSVAALALSIGPAAAAQADSIDPFGAEQQAAEPSPADIARELSHSNLSVRRRGAKHLDLLDTRAREILPTIKRCWPTAI